VLAELLLVHIDYRVSAKTVIEGEIQRVVAAPFEGFIGASFVRAGDIVKQGQALAQLDDRDLKIEQVRWASERDQNDNKLREAMATHDMTAMQVIGAQLRQSEAQLALVTEKIERAHLTAPYDGVVVSGDLSQQIGSPVESGKKLFEVAPLQSYRVILQVDEREIRHVKEGQTGQMVITGIAGDPMPLSVVKVTPVATAQDGKNFFRVEASLGDEAKRLRPGMEGVGKIEVGSQQLWWILTHSFTDWLILSVWTWMP
jgi:RND family efflux transporter MFP subunit